MSELQTILSSETENPLTREQLFAQRRQLEAELAAAQAEGEKQLLPLRVKRDEARDKHRLASIAFNNCDLSCRDKENGLRATIDGLNVKLRSTAPASVTRLLNTIHDRRTSFQEYPFNHQLRREHRGILGGRSFAEQSCDAWISEAMTTFLRLQNEAEDLRLLDCENLDAEIAEIYAAIPDVEKPEYVEV